MNNKKTMIVVTKQTRSELNLIKIIKNFKSVDEVINHLIKNDKEKNN